MQSADWRNLPAAVASSRIGESRPGRQHPHAATRGATRLARALLGGHRRCPRAGRRVAGGQSPAVPPAPEVARWLGRDGRHDRRPRPAGQGVGAGGRLHLLDRAVLPNRERRPLRRPHHRHRRLRARRARGPAADGARRDINRHNVLIARRGPLLDFDRSAPEVPWWERRAPRVLPRLPVPRARPGRTPSRCGLPSPGTPMPGGPVGPADPTAFTGLLQGLLDWVANGVVTSASGNTFGQARRSLPTILRLPWTAGLRCGTAPALGRAPCLRRTTRKGALVNAER
jgi:hypothetical protein